MAIDEVVKIGFEMGKNSNIILKARKNEPADKLIKRFIKKVKKEKIVEQVRDGKYYKKPSVKKKEKKRKAELQRMRNEARRLKRLRRHSKRK